MNNSLDILKEYNIFLGKPFKRFRVESARVICNKIILKGQARNAPEKGRTKSHQAEILSKK